MPPVESGMLKVETGRLGKIKRKQQVKKKHLRYQYKVNNNKVQIYYKCFEEKAHQKGFPGGM